MKFREQHLPVGPGQGPEPTPGLPRDHLRILSEIPPSPLSSFCHRGIISISCMMDPAAHVPRDVGAVALGVPALEDVVELWVQGVINGYKLW